MGSPIKIVALALVLACFLTGACSGAGDADFVTSFALEGLVQTPGHLFDWQGKTIRFQPVGGGTYKVQKLPSARSSTTTVYRRLP